MAVDPDAMKRRYFTEIAPRYAQMTGNATRDVWGEILQTQDLGITSDSVIHDNAAGPGTATEALIDRFRSRGEPAPQIVVTDYVPAMIEAFEALRKGGTPSSWNNVEAKVVDSADLSEFEDGTFSHSICNLSVFTFTRPAECLREMHRTLTAGGVAVVTSWKRFAAAELMAAAQNIVKGAGWSEAHAVPVNGPEWFEEGYTARMVAEAGFPADQTDTLVVRHVVQKRAGSDWDGLYGFLTDSSVKDAATREWTEEELGRWPEAVQEAMQKEAEAFGGVLFEAWAVIARK